MAPHDFGHLGPVRRSTGRRPHHLSHLAEVLWTDSGRRDDAKRFDVAAAVVIEAVNGTASNPESLSRPEVNRLTIDGPGEHAFDAVDCLLVVIVAVRRRRQALRGGNRELEEGYAAARIFSGDQKPHGERSETDGLVGRVHVNVARLRCHGSSFGQYRRYSKSGSSHSSSNHQRAQGSAASSVGEPAGSLSQRDITSWLAAQCGCFDTRVWRRFAVSRAFRVRVGGRLVPRLRVARSAARLTRAADGAIDLSSGASERGVAAAST